ncbi:hypothetical protein HJFPF1_04140 [Paramyrothecium foliicola]|nr:hypothetical protein HJFPF1_04140 [Paramyrothecium foliicola]
MRFNLLTFVACVASGAVGSAIPHDHAEHAIRSEDLRTSPNPRSQIEIRDSFDCKGSSICSTMPVASCDRAVNFNLIRDDGVNYGAPGSGRRFTGTCSKYAIGGLGTQPGCGIFIQGKSHCARSGNEMWWDYQHIRSNGCGKCGTKHWGDGCMTTINYVSTCDRN